MIPDEVVSKVRAIGEIQELDIDASRSSVLRAEKKNGIGLPERGSDGRGKGRYTEYPEDTPYEYFAFWVLSNRPYRLNHEQIAAVRITALQAIEQLPAQAGKIASELLVFWHTYTGNVLKKEPYWLTWWKLKIMAEAGVKIPRTSGGILQECFSMPSGIDPVYDKLMDTVIEKSLLPTTDVENNIQEHWKSSIVRCKGEIDSIRKRIENFEKVLEWYQLLPEKEKKQLNQLADIKMYNQPLSAMVTERIEKLYPGMGEIFLDSLLY